MELRIALQPKQIQFLEAIKSHRYTFFGGAKGGGKSGGLRRIMLLRRLEMPGTAGAIFRKTYPELYGNHIEKLFTEYPELREFYNDSKKKITFPNGSTIDFCYARNEKDLGNYQGREWDDLAIDEAGEWSEHLMKRLFQSNRSSKPGVKPRGILTGNPGGLGHAYLKRVFVQRKFQDAERPEDYAFIQALVDDNAALMENDPEYVRTLDAEKNEALRKAYRHGSWDIVAGQFFSELRREVHLIKPFKIPDHWLRFGALDYGFNHPASFGWFACDEDGNVYLYREYAKSKQREDQQAAAYKSYDDTARLDYIVAGHDCWADRGVTFKSGAHTIAEEFGKNGIDLSRANIGRKQGAAQLRNYLAWEGKSGEENGRPRFFIFDTCPITFDCISRMVYDPDDAEDVLKVDSENGDPSTGDDPYDMVRYALMSRPPVAERQGRGPKPGTEEWMRKEAEEMEQAALRSIQQANGLEFPDDPWSKNLTQFDNR